MKLITQGDKDANPVDRHYQALNCTLDVLKKTDGDYKVGLPGTLGHGEY